MTVKWPLQKDAEAFYGNPRGTGGKESAAWVKANIVYVKPPFALYYDGKPMSKGVRVHHLCADSLRAVYAEIWEAYGRSQSALDATGFTKCGGGYTFRNKRQGSTLSMHAYGCAVDHDPARNGQGDTTPEFRNHPRILNAFARQGWEWGGDWSGKSCDGMHWQAAWTKAKPARVNKAPALKPATPAKVKPGNGSLPTENAYTKSEMESIQKRLTELGYNPGMVDGRYGAITGRAVAAFAIVNDIPGVPVDTIPRSLRDAILSSAAKPMQVEAARATATPAEIAARVPEAAAARQGFFANAGEKVLAIGTAAVAYFRESIGDAVTTLKPVTDALGDIPPQLVWTGVAVIAGTSVYMAYRAGQKVNTAYQQGRI